MSQQLLAQALAVAYNPNSSVRQLLDVIGDLIAFGSFDASIKVLERLREAGAEPPYARKLEKSLQWLHRYGSGFEDSLLAGALAVARDRNSDEKQLLKAAECLVVWGSLDEADHALARLSENEALRGPVSRLAAASRQLRRSGILQELQSLTPAKSLNKPYEVLVRRREGAERVIIVFTGVALRFWLSLNALHVFLRKLDSHVVYLSDHSGTLYLNGLTSLGAGYERMLEVLEEQLQALGCRKLFVLASSAGGFVGLRAAIDLRADCFAGMSIRTSLVPFKGFAPPPMQQRILERCRDPGMIIDLHDMLAASDYPSSVQLYCGEATNADRTHAEHLADIPRVEVQYLKEYRRHDVISGLIARGELDAMLKRFVGDTPTGVGEAAGIQ